MAQIQKDSAENGAATALCHTTMIFFDASHTIPRAIRFFDAMRYIRRRHVTYAYR